MRPGSTSNKADGGDESDRHTATSMKPRRFKREMRDNRWRARSPSSPYKHGLEQVCLQHSYNWTSCCTCKRRRETNVATCHVHPLCIRSECISRRDAACSQLVSPKDTATLLAFLAPAALQGQITSQLRQLTSESILADAHRLW